MIKRLLLALFVFAMVIVGMLWIIGAAGWTDRPTMREPARLARKVPEVPSQSTQILFGDLHVHTSFSMDAAIFGTPAVKGTGYYSPADACDFARYCSALDFWSINDHAEGLAPWQWQATKNAVRQCNAVTPRDNPDMVTFLGWEWSQGSADAPVHYGHKNVVLLGIEDNEVPVRPIASDRRSIWRMIGTSPAPLRGAALLSASADGGLAAYGGVAEHLQAVADSPECADAPVRELAADCYEYAETPSDLYKKLDDWGFDALVIPHGLAWGTTNPVGADFAVQLQEHNPKYQRLLEVYSGHGNSEIYRTMPRSRVSESGEVHCPTPTVDYTACCWQAGLIVEQRCVASGGDDCQALAASARRNYVLADSGVEINAAKAVVPATHPDDWGTCDQLTGSFQPANNYQPKQSAQYIFSLGDRQNRVRMGLMGSSDNHTARAGSSYKEFARYYMTDTKDTGKPIPASDPSAYVPRDAEDVSILEGFNMATNKDAFYYSGGLVAVHSQGRDRESIWQALQRREVYGTSGPRIELWFDLVDRQGNAHPMGSEIWSVPNPRFRIRARGAAKQLAGCPELAHTALGEDQLARLCRGECFNPSDERYAIERIEIVRILPRLTGQEATADLIQDPYAVLECEPGAEFCEAEFTDQAFGAMGREAVYYARAIQEQTDAINGDPMGCTSGESGECEQVNYCIGVAPEEDCLSPTRHRAWSSPIFVQFAGE